MASRARRVSSRAKRGICSWLLAVTVAGCTPRLPPLTGISAPEPLPPATLGTERQHIVFKWELEDADFIARGEGAARVAPPDSARMDFFLGGGVGGGSAVLIADELRLQDQQSDIIRRVVPSPPLLWATLGRLALPVRDNVARRQGDTLRADFGQPVVWRVTFIRDTLRRLERVESDRVLEWVDRSPQSGRVRYRHEGNRRQLDLQITLSFQVRAFDPKIWILQ
jgi:hypothetical protein